MGEHREEFVLAAVVLEQFVGAPALGIGEVAQARDVGHHEHEAANVAVLVEHRIGDDAKPGVAHLQVERLARELTGGADVEHGVIERERLAKHVAYRTAGDLGGRAAREREQRAVGAEDQPVVVQDGGGFGNGVEGPSPFHRGLAEAGLGVVGAEQRADRRDQFLRFDRLDEVAVGTAIESLGPALGVDEGRRGLQHRNVGGPFVGLEATADLEAVQVGELDVEHDEPRRLTRQHQRLVAGRRFPHVVADPPQGAAQDVPRGLIVVDGEDDTALFRRHRPPHGPERRGGRRTVGLRRRIRTGVSAGLRFRVRRARRAYPRPPCPAGVARGYRPKGSHRQ